VLLFACCLGHGAAQVPAACTTTSLRLRVTARAAATILSRDRCLLHWRSGLRLGIEEGEGRRLVGCVSPTLSAAVIGPSRLQVECGRCRQYLRHRLLAKLQDGEPIGRKWNRDRDCERPVTLQPCRSYPSREGRHRIVTCRPDRRMQPRLARPQQTFVVISAAEDTSAQSGRIPAEFYRLASATQCSKSGPCLLAHPHELATCGMQKQIEQFPLRTPNPP
jgi:hypothetical protein